MEAPHSREQLEREERFLRRRLREVRRQIDAYDDGEAVHVETYHAYKKRTGEE
jgi:ribosomal protein L21E